MHNRILLLAVAAAALGLSACGSKDHTGASAAATSPAASSGPAVTTSQTPAAFDAASGKVTIKATEFAFSPSVITAPAGRVKITMENDGATVHELVLLKTGATPGSLKVVGGKVSEQDSVGEISETEAGESKSHTFDLKAGKYVIVCNVDGHYMKGMYGELVVS